MSRKKQEEKTTPKDAARVSMFRRRGGLGHVFMHNYRRLKAVHHPPTSIAVPPGERVQVIHTAFDISSVWRVFSGLSSTSPTSQPADDGKQPPRVKKQPKKTAGGRGRNRLTSSAIGKRPVP